MIITDFKQLRDVPAGEVVTLMLKLKTEKVDEDGLLHCGKCILGYAGCKYCRSGDRPDRTEVIFEKI